MNEMIKLPFEISGTVAHGKKMGRTIGFPTINLVWDGSCSLPYGVYISEVAAEGCIYMGMTNIGCHPTLPEGGLTAETYLLDVNVDMYDKPVTVKLLKFTRPEKRFEGVGALTEQLTKDLEDTRAYFKDRI